ncbi:guanine deaminase [bacterium]|nr:MAG: guanine deaminase [bacterium]
MKRILPFLFILIRSCSSLPDSPQLYHASLVYFTDNPSTNPDALKYIEDGGLVIDSGKIVFSGVYHDAKNAFPNARIHDYSGKFILPGFIDTHIHYPQTEMIASYGEQLLEWLNSYTFPTEKHFASKSYADSIAAFFVDELLKNGTTTALVFGTVHSSSVEALFEQAESHHMRLIAGKVLMDRNAPDYLLDTPESAYEESKTLIERWHHKDRLSYAVTPRFAPTSTPEQLGKAAQLLQEYPDVFMHTHLSENKGEVEWVKSLFPNNKGYLDVYNHFGLTGSRSIFAHSIYLTEQEWDVMSSTESGIAFCPTSNLFLGSGLFDVQKATQKNVKVGLGTDVGGGTSFSMLQTMNEAYKVTQLRKAFAVNPSEEKPLSALQAFYLATLGGAKVLNQEAFIGSLEAGKEADFIVLNPHSTDLMNLRMSKTKTIEEKLFVLMMLGDDRTVEQTYVLGDAQK